MRIPVTKYGLPQAVVFPAIIIVAMAVCLLAGVRFLPGWVIYLIEIIFVVALIFCLSFFRDPYRRVVADKNILLAPADGRVTDIELVEANEFIGGRALRVGIFLSIFDVHINRAPCDVRVEKITYRKGRYKDARNPQAGCINESNNLAMVRTESPYDKLVVRQISGAIARRIVCAAREGQELSGGQRFGMIKFGSRTELYVPAREEVKGPPSEEKSVWEPKCVVKIGDKVKAGLSVLVRYERCPD